MVQHSSFHRPQSQILPALPGPGPGKRGRELDSYSISPSLKTLFLLLYLGTLPFALGYKDKSAFSVGISISKISCFTPGLCPSTLRDKECSTFVSKGNLQHQCMSFPLWLHNMGGTAVIQQHIN